MSEALTSQLPSSPLVDPVTGQVTPAWRAFFLAMLLRTGGGPGVDVSQVQTSLAEEATTRANADTALGARITTETNAREAADALLVPIAQLGTLWAGNDLRFLPTANPGGGQPWRGTGGVLTVSP